MPNYNNTLDNLMPEDTAGESKEVSISVKKEDKEYPKVEPCTTEDNQPGWRAGKNGVCHPGEYEGKKQASRDLDKLIAEENSETPEEESVEMEEGTEGAEVPTVKSDVIKKSMDDILGK